MSERREFLASLGKGNIVTPPFKSCPRGRSGPTAARFPKVVVQDQNNKKAWFYEELIYNKLVLINFTSISGERHYPIINNMVKVQEMLANRLDKDVFIYTITTRPTEDSAAKLKIFAQNKGAKWQFLTGSPDNIREILKAFGIRGRINGLSWIGNEKTGRWLSKASRQHPLYIAEAVARLSTGKHYKPFLVDMRSV